MKDIPIIRIFRYALVVMIVLTTVAYSNPANAESGTIHIQGASIRSYYQLDTPRVIGGNAQNWNVIYYDSASMNHIVDFQLNLTNSWTSTNSSNMTAFTITSGGSGTGWLSYDNRLSNASLFALYYFFDNNVVITSSPITITLQTNILNDISAAGTVYCSSESLTSAKPIAVYAGGGPCVANPYQSAVGYTNVNVGTSTDNFYNLAYFNNYQGFVLNVTKENIATKVQVLDDLSNIYFTEGTFNTLTLNYLNGSYNGVTLNISTADGSKTITVINHSSGFVSPTANQTTPGQGGSLSGQIYYNFNSATIGQTYGINASISNTNFTAFTTYYIYGYDVNNNLISGFPIDFSTQNYTSGKFWTFNKSGTYNATLRYCNILECVLGIKHDLDTASIFIPPASYAFTVTTDQANYQLGNIINIVATNPSPNPAYLTAFGETGIITDIAWNTLIPAGQSVGLSRVIPQNMPLGTYNLNLATTQSYYPIVAQAVFNISSPGNTTNTLSALWGESLYLLGNVGTVTTTSNWNASTLTITSPTGVATSYSFPANSTNYTLITLNAVGQWNARIVDNNNASVFSQSNTTVTLGNPTANETIELCKSAATYVCWDKRQYTQGQAYVISFQLKPKVTDISSISPYIEITNPSGTVIYNQSVNGTFDQNAFMYVGSLSGSFDPQASTGLYFARLKNKNILGEIEIRAESAAEVVAGATPTTTEGQVSTTTATNLLNVLGMIAFYGLLLYVGLLFGLIRLMTRNGAHMDGSSFVYAAVILANIVALIGLFDPFKMYVLVLTWIIAGATFTLGRRAVSGAD